MARSRTGTRLKLAGVVAALVLTGAACSDSSEEEASTTTMSPEMSTTTMLQPTGAACGQVPTSGEGSVEGMRDDTIGTAASNNPLLSTLVEAVTAANLVDTLNSTAPPAPFTVFAPINPAFEKIPAADLQALLANQEQLTAALTYPVIPNHALTLEELNDGAQLASVQTGNVTIGKEGETVRVNPDAGEAGATVICGNVPVANGVVHLIDTVLTPPAATNEETTTTAAQ